MRCAYTAKMASPSYPPPNQVRVPPMTGIRFEVEPDPRHWLHLVQIPEETTADDGIPRAMGAALYRHPARSRYI